MKFTQERLELAQLILDGFDEVTLYNLWGPGWRTAIVGIHHNEDP